MGFKSVITNFITGQKNSEIKSSTRTDFTLNDAAYVEYLVGKPKISEAIFSVVSRISNTFAALPLKLIDDSYKKPNDSKGFDIVYEGPRYFTRFDFLRDIETLRNMHGNVYVQIFRDINGAVNDLAIIKPDCCTPFFDTSSGELYYRVRATDNTTHSQEVFVHYMEILHLKHTRTSGGIKGTSPLDILSNTMNYDNEVRKISLSQLNGTNEGFKVKLATNMNEEDKNTTILNIANFYKDNGGLLVEENGVEIERIERSLVDSKLLDVDKISKSRIAMVYNVSRYFVDGDKSAGNLTQEQLNTEFLTYTLLPIITQYEQEFNKKLLTKKERGKGYRFKFNAAGFLRADTATRGSFYQIMRRNGAYSANNVRVYEDLEPIDSDAMNQFHISGDLYPIELPAELRKTTTIEKDKGGD